MSYSAMDAVYEMPMQDGLAKYVLLTIAKHCDDEMQAYPSIERLAKLTGLSVSTVKRKLAALEKDGHLAVNRRSSGGKKTSNLYTIKTASSRVTVTASRVTVSHEYIS